MSPSPFFTHCCEQQQNQHHATTEDVGSSASSSNISDNSQMDTSHENESFPHHNEPVRPREVLQHQHQHQQLTMGVLLSQGATTINTNIDRPPTMPSLPPLGRRLLPSNLYDSLQEQPRRITKTEQVIEVIDTVLQILDDDDDCFWGEDQAVDGFFTDLNQQGGADGGDQHDETSAFWRQ